MPVTKITLSTAMRARDVSRPRDDQLAQAAEREDTVTRHPEPTPPPRPAPPRSEPSPPEPAQPRRRRRRRS